MSNYIVDFVNSATEAEIQEYLTQNQCTLVKRFQHQHFEKIILVSADVVPPKTAIVEYVILDDDTAAVKLLDIVPAENIDPSGNTVIDSASDRDWWKAFSYSDLDFSIPAQTVPLFGNNVSIYLVDSGIDNTHPEFTGRTVTLLHSVVPNDFTDTTGHGTALASAMIGNTCGMTTAHVKVVKLWDKTHQTLQSDILASLDAILTDYFGSNTSIAVVNMSWSIPKNSYIESKIQTLINAGMLVVAAAGNSGQPIGDVTPASMASVVTIGSYGPSFKPSDFSDYSDSLSTSLTLNSTNSGELDRWAPGENIYTAMVGGGYGNTAGTSIAAAIYSASLAYNASQFLYQASPMPTIYTNGVLNYELINHRDRSGLLDLSDPKYNSSINRICTFYVVYQQNSRNPPAIKMVATVGKTDYRAFYYPQLTTSYEFLNLLPSSVTISRELLIFSPTIPTANPSKVQQEFISCLLTMKDGTTITQQIELVQLNEDFNAEALPPDDPLIEITQLAACRSSFPPNCTSALPCVSQPCYTGGTKGNYYCTCA